jgi:1,4-dihydroxy-2-naphthoate octaprenyltransferase
LYNYIDAYSSALSTAPFFFPSKYENIPIMPAVDIDIHTWLLAIRPKTLPAAGGPVIVGTAVAIADHAFSFFPALAALIGCLLLQIGVNLANDYFDFVKGIDEGKRLGPVRVTQSGLIPPETIKKAMIATLALAGLVALYLMTVGGWPIFWIAVASIIGALTYSGGPFPMASHGLADLFVCIFFGIVAVCGTYYVQAQDLTWTVFFLSFPIGLVITAILVVNNYRDIGTDAVSGKRSLAVIIGPSLTRIEFILLLCLTYAIPLFLAAAQKVSLWAAFLPLLSLPLAMSCIRDMNRLTGQPLNNTLAKTAKLSLLIGLLLAAGIVL